MYINRLIYQSVKKAMDGFPAVLLTGPRQSGKSTFLREEIGAACSYVTFDDPLMRERGRTDPNGLLDQFKDRILILDEVQYVPEILPLIKIRADAVPGRSARWIMTGSQRFELMRHVTESLAGRVCILELLPFSLRELAGVAPGSLAELLWRGFYPPSALALSERDLWVRSYVQSYIERDVRALQQIRDLRLFETFLGLIAASHAKEANLASISRDAGVSQPTCKQWLSVLEASYVITLLPPYHRNLGKRLIKSPKLYFIDTAITSYLTRQPDPGSMLAGSMAGAFFEGFVVCEALKAFTNSGRRPELYFWRSHDGLEVDLLIESAGKVHPVEIKLTATPMPRHAEPLKRLRTLLGPHACAPGVVVCTAEKPLELTGNVNAMPWQLFPQWVASL